MDAQTTQTLDVSYARLRNTLTGEVQPISVLKADTNTCLQLPIFCVNTLFSMSPRFLQFPIIKVVNDACFFPRARWIDINLCIKYVAKVQLGGD